MASTSAVVVLPVECNDARRQAIKALHAAKFSGITVTGDVHTGFAISASRKVAGQWKPVAISVTLAPQGPGTTVGAYASAAPHSVIAVFRSPSQVTVTSFLDQLLALERNARLSNVRRAGISGAAVWGTVIVGLALIALALVCLRSNAVGPLADPPQPRTDRPVSSVEPTRAASSSAMQTEPVLPQAEIVAQAITLVGATVSLRNRSDAEQVVEVELAFNSDGAPFASGSVIVRLPSGEDDLFVDVLADHTGPIPSEYTVEVIAVRVI